MKRLGALLLLPALVMAARVAEAHVALRYPPSRYGDNVLKVGPCGAAGGGRSTHVTTLEAGATVEVSWNEYINHPGHFRISFDADGDDDFVDPRCTSGCTTTSPNIEKYSNTAVLLDAVADTPQGGLSSAQVTLPDIECERCTLQLIQVMYDKPPYTLPGDDIYYQCADLVLRRAATPEPTASASPTPPATPTVALSPTATATCDVETPGCQLSCSGDCDGNGDVTVDELVTMVAIILGEADVAGCPSGDADGNGTIEVTDVVAALLRSLGGCPAGTSMPSRR